MKVLLIYPPVQANPGIRLLFKPPPLSLLQLAAMVPEHEVQVLDLNANPRIYSKDLEQIISKYDLVGISCNSNVVKIALNLCKIAKKNGVKTVLGGYHPTLAPDLIKEPSIDYIVRGEGENTFKELVDGINPKEILGLSYKEDGSYHHNEPRPLIPNLGELPFPRKGLVDYSRYNYLLVPLDLIETSRGCPNNCSFCCVPKFYGRTWREKSPNRVIKELSMVPRNQKLILFVDDNFSAHSNRVKTICRLIREKGLHEKFSFTCQARVDDIARNPEMVREMAKSGFICFFIGIESLKQMSLKSMNKNINLNQIKKAINICHDNGIIIIGSFIIGNVGETRKDVLKSYELMKKVDIDFILTNPIIPYPGTPLWEEAIKNGWFNEDFNWQDWANFDPIMNTPDLTIDEIQKLKDLSMKYFYFDFIYRTSYFYSTKLYKNKRIVKLAAKTILNALKNFKF